MNIRVSTTQYFKATTQRMTDQQANLSKIQSQLSTGVGVQKPSDDPLALATALGAQAAVKTIDAYQNNLKYVTNDLTQMDTTLGSASNVMQSIKDSMIQAGNAALSPADREVIAKDLEGQIDELRGLANAQDASGNYIFSGTYQDKKPFSVPGDAGYSTGSFLETGSQAAAQAVTGKSVQVSNGRTLDTNITGNDAFVSSKTGEDIFKTLTDAVALLRDPGYPNGQQGATPADTFAAAFRQKAGAVDQVFNDLQLARTKVGVRLREADTLSAINDAASTQQQTVATEAVGLDYAKAISELSQGQLQLQASQQSFASTSKLSLFNYL